MEDGYNDGMENLRDDSYDVYSSYRGKKWKQYELGYKKDIKQNLMMAFLITIVPNNLS